MTKKSNQEPAGLSWRKLDLHVHTPASADFDRRDLTPDELITAAVDAGLDGIAITDHNTAEWIDRVSAAAEGRIAVFPGVEITATGGKNGTVHLIALFDPKCRAKTIENLLGKLDIRADAYGTAEAHTPKGPYEVITAIAELGGLAILAHADSAKGVLHDMKGQPRIRIVCHPKLSAAEVHDFEKYQSMLDGTHSVYRRVLAVFRASDNRSSTRSDRHSAEGIGARYSYFKMDGMTIESLRQCFCDRDVRIRPDSGPSMPSPEDHPRLVGVSIRGGFLDGQSATFHDGLNSLIGGKGVGKSLVVEFVRFALGQMSALIPMQDDARGKLAWMLGVGGRVTVTLRLATGQMIAVTRTYDGDENPYEVEDLEAGESIEADIAELFPILAYSQTEAIEIARDLSAQLRLIDTFIDLTDIDQRAAALRNQLAQSDRDLAKAQQAAAGLEEKRGEFNTTKAQVEHLAEALESERFGELDRLRPKTDFFTELEEHVFGVSTAVKNAIAELEAAEPPAVPDAYASDEDLRGLIERAEDLRDVIRAAVRNHLARLASFSDQVGAASRRWAEDVEQKTREFQAWIDEVGGDKRALLAKHQSLSRRLASLRTSTKALDVDAEKAVDLRSVRDRLLRELVEVEAERSTRREKEYTAITEASNGRLRLTLNRGADSTKYLNAVLQFKRGSGLHQSSVQQVVNGVAPARLVSLVLSDDANTLAQEARIDIKTANRLVASFLELDLEDLLALEYAVLPSDQPEIRFQKDDGSYYPLSALSVGQKCAALLIIALARGDMPVIIDQPEDALDVRSIYDDVTKHLRARKDSRQFILTTHNSTVAVAGDSDRFHVLRGSADAGELVPGGAIDRREVREEVIRHLEGGRSSFDLKRRKYGISDEEP